MSIQKHLLITPIISFLVASFALVALAQLPEAETVPPEEMPPVEEAVALPEEAVAEEAIPEPVLEEVIPEPVAEMIKADEEIPPEQLEVKEPRILPDHPLYGLKNIWRGIKKAVTFDPVKKAELELQYANEKMIEANKMVEKNEEKLKQAEKNIKEAEKNIEEAKVSDKPDQEIKEKVEEAEKKKEEAEKTIEKIGDKVERVLDSYAEDIERIKDRAAELKEKLKDEPEMDKFIDKFVDHNFKQQKLLDKIEKNLPAKALFVKTKEVKEKSLENLGQILHQFVPPEKIDDKITQVIEKQKGSDFKDFKNLEILKELEDKVPEPAKVAIRLAQNNTLERMEKQMETLPEERQELFNEYIRHISGHEVRHMEIIHDFESREIPESIREMVEKAKEKAFQRIKERMNQLKLEHEKEMFLKHLEDGEMEDLRIIKELENNLPPQVIDQIVEIKNKAKLQFREKFEQAPTPEAFFAEIERFHDVRQLEILKELEEVIPEDKKEVFEQLRNQVIDEMKREIEMAKGIREMAMIIDKLAGDSPEHIQIIKEFGPPPEIMNEIMKEQMKKLSKKVETIEDVERLELLKRKIEEEEVIRNQLENEHPEIFRKIDERKEMFFGEMTIEKASARIEEAKAEILLAENEYEALDEATQNEILQRSPFQVLLNLAYKHVARADESLANESYGEAFGQATAALHEANSARRIIKEISLRRQMPAPEMEEKFFEREFEKRSEFKERFEKDFRQEEMFMPGQFREMIMPVGPPGLRPGMMPGRPSEEMREFDQAEFFKTKLPDAAVTYCQKLGYQTEARFDRGKKEYVCLLPDGLACYAWDFYNGKCGQQYRKEIKEILKEELKEQMPGQTEMMEPSEQYYPEKPEISPEPERPEACIQMITPAKDPITGYCREFPTPCEVPASWIKVDRCEKEMMMPPEGKMYGPPAGQRPPQEEMSRPPAGEMRPPAEQIPPEETGGIFRIFKRLFRS